MPVPRLIHLNGPPGIGKSTLARRYGADHPGTLVCDIDVLRAMVGGWESDFHGAGSRIRSAALAMISAYLLTGDDVVLPQLISRRDEQERFRAAATDVGAQYQCLLLMAEPGDVVRRFHARHAESGADPWLRRVHEVVQEQGGDDALIGGRATLLALAAVDPAIVVVPSTDPDNTYAAVLAATATS